MKIKEMEGKMYFGWRENNFFGGNIGVNGSFGNDAYLYCGEIDILRSENNQNI
jgi:hypothetical protein